MSSNPTTSKWNAFGPGILFAGSAVGTSHIVQSTCAGADYSMVLLLIFILIAIVKYPAIRFGKDYSAITGKTLIHSYAGLGWPILLIYGVIIVISAAFVSAALALVTNSIVQSALPLGLNGQLSTALTLIVSAFVLMSGKYRFLELLNKFLVPVFTILILFTTFVVMMGTDWGSLSWSLPVLNKASLLYVVAIAGWLLTPMDASIFMSVWTVAKSKNDGVDYGKSNLDFNIGYWTSLILALCFMILGASVVSGSADSLPQSGSGFIVAVLEIFSNAIGLGLS